MKGNRILGIIALVVWGHLMVGLYPFPFQREAQVRELARQAVSSQKNLQSLGVELPSATEQEWTSGLTLDIWKGWIKNFMFLVLGIAAASWALLNRRGWQLALILLSMTMIYVTMAPLVSSMGEMGLARWFRVWKTVIEKRLANGEEVFSYFAMLYWMFVWPLCHACLVIAVGVLMANTRGRDAPKELSA